MPENKKSNIKFKLLCWKLWLIIKRNPVTVILEACIPVVLIFLFLAIINQTKNNKIDAKPSIKFNINPPLCQYASQEITKLAYSPEIGFYSILMQDVAKNFNVDLKEFEDDEKLNNWIKNQTEPVAAVAFDDSENYPPKHLKYTIRMPDNETSLSRWNTDKLYYLEISKESRPQSYSYQDSLYYSTCFLKLQNEIDQAFINTFNNGTQARKLNTLKTFPYPEVEVFKFEPFTGPNSFIGYIFYVLPFVFLLSLILSVKVLIKNITIERESRLTESMKILGLSSALYWSSWFMRSFIILLISFTIVVILTSVSIFSSSNPFIIWIFFMSYITSMITFCFLVSVVFKKSSRAGIVGSIVFIATVLPYMFYQTEFHRFGYGLKVLFCLLPNTNMGQGIKMILVAEVNDSGIRFGNSLERSFDLKFSFAELLLWMNIGSIFQMLLTICIKHFLYEELDDTERSRIPIKNAFLKLLKTICKHKTGQKLNHIETNQLLSSTNVIENLSKKYGNEYAIQDFSINLGKNKITVLLGPSRAGKSSIVSMLTGLYQPTSGAATIIGYDISTQIDDARRSMGVCLQQNALFEELTVQENLEFFCKLRGMQDIKDIQKDIFKYAESLNMSDQLGSQTKALNDLQKRKLSIIIALCGDSKFVILDEPLAGLDQSSRQQLLKLLDAEKETRSILVTANILDEAEIFGDQIAIMSNGRLLTVESPSSLRKNHKIGYQLTCVKKYEFKSQSVLDLINNAVLNAKDKPETSPKVAANKEPHDEPRQSMIKDNLETTDVSKVTKIQINKLEIQHLIDRVKNETKNSVPVATLISESDTEAVFAISKDLLPVFDQIFESLESKSEHLWIESYKFDYMSLEDAVLQLSYKQSEQEDETENVTGTAVHNQNPDTIAINLYKNFEKCFRNVEIIQQIHAMLLKKFYVLRKSWMLLAILTVMSFIVIVLVPIIFYIRPDKSTRLPISFDSYGDTETLVHIQKNSSISQKFLNSFSEKDQIIEISGIESAVLKEYQMKNHKNLIAATFKEKEIIAWFNTQPYHTMPLIINTVNRAILKSLAGSDYDISVTNYPFTQDDIADNLVIRYLIIIFLLLIWPMIYIGYYIQERITRFKLLQFICGTNRFVYWLANLIFDYILFILICFVLFICFSFSIFKANEWFDEFQILMIIGISYGFSWICFIYAFSYLFSKPLTGRIWLLSLSIVLCISSVFFDFLQSQFELLAVKYLLEILSWFWMMFAPFTLVKINQEVFFGTRPFDNSKLNESIGMNLLTGSIFLLVAISHDYNFKARIQQLLRKPTEVLSLNSPQLDETLQNENQSSCDEDYTESVAASNKLLKTYKNLTAIHQQSRNEEQIQAGKKTKFKMINGNEPITPGDIWVKRNCQKSQFDNFIPVLTTREVLKVFALICGSKLDEIGGIIQDIATEIKLEEQLDKRIETFNGEDRKKLFTALAQLGNRDVIFLNECTTAADRRALLGIPDINESEALYTRIGIMVAGQFQCLGPIQHLKNKFSKGFVLTIKTGLMNNENVKELRRKLFQKFLDIELIGKNLDILVLHLTTSSMKYSEIFRILSEIKDEMKFEDYTLAEMTLERFFLNISKQEAPFSQEESIQIAKEEQKWKLEEINERIAKISEETQRIKKMKNQARKLGKKIARRQLKKQQEEHDQQEIEEIRKMEEKKAELEKSINEEVAKAKAKPLLKRIIKGKNVFISKKSMAKKLREKMSKEKEKSISSEYHSKLKDKRNYEHFNRRPIYGIKSNDSSEDDSDEDSSDDDSSDEPNLEDKNDLNDLCGTLVKLKVEH